MFAKGHAALQVPFRQILGQPKPDSNAHTDRRADEEPYDDPDQPAIVLTIAHAVTRSGRQTSHQKAAADDHTFTDSDSNDDTL